MTIRYLDRDPIDYRDRSQQLERLVDGAALGRRDLQAEEIEESLEPLGRPGALSVVVDARQWVEREILVPFAGDGVVVAAGGLGERHRRVALVEDEDLGFGIAEPLRLEEAEQRRLALARGPNDERMADV